MEGAASTSGDRLPSIHLHTAELIKYRDERKSLVFTVLGGDSLEGFIRWFDDEAIHLVEPDRNEVTLFKHSVLFYRAKSL